MDATTKNTPSESGSSQTAMGAEELQMDKLRAAGSAFLGAMQGPGLAGRLHDLMHRIETGTETPDDERLLSTIPPCHLSPRELVALFSRVERLM